MAGLPGLPVQVLLRMRSQPVVQKHKPSTMTTAPTTIHASLGHLKNYDGRYIPHRRDARESSAFMYNITWCHEWGRTASGIALSSLSQFWYTAWSYQLVGMGFINALRGACDWQGRLFENRRNFCLVCASEP